MLAYVREFVPEPRKAPLAGNTVGTDRAFLARDMPELEGWMHYRVIDVSSIKELTRQWYPRAYFAAPGKAGNHRALADITESIDELRYYRKAVFVPPPGPDTEAARALAAEVGAKDRARRGCRAVGGKPLRCVTLVLAVPGACPARVVGVAQLVEHRLVVPVAAGSSPVVHPTEPLHTRSRGGGFPVHAVSVIDAAGCRRSR